MQLQLDHIQRNISHKKMIKAEINREINIKLVRRWCWMIKKIRHETPNKAKHDEARRAHTSRGGRAKEWQLIKPRWAKAIFAPC
jgi:hypothetical protein